MRLPIQLLVHARCCLGFVDHKGQDTLQAFWNRSESPDNDVSLHHSSGYFDWNKLLREVSDPRRDPAHASNLLLRCGTSPTCLQAHAHWGDC